MAAIEIETPHGVARAHLETVAGRRAALILGHGAGGGVSARDLQAAREAALAQQFAVALVEQPYRVAGRRAPPRAPQLDAAWISVVADLRAGALSGLPVIVGGRSMGARVACRTAAATEASGVVCLAFPLLPPRRARAGKPPESRQAELDGVELPTLVIQGARDPFGIPAPGPLRTIVEVAGDHSLRSDLGAVGEAVGSWLARLADGF